MSDKNKWPKDTITVTLTQDEYEAIMAGIIVTSMVEVRPEAAEAAAGVMKTQMLVIDKFQTAIEQMKGK